MQAVEAELSAPITSLTGREWIVREADERLALALMQSHGLPEVLARILAARGVGVEEAPGFLAPTVKALLPDPSHLLDMDTAAERVATAIINNEKIAVFGDYDVDGATSSALLARYFRALGSAPILYIPDRMTEGYGPNAPAMRKLKEQGAVVVITVDCGTLAFEALDAAHEVGLDVIVIDHHQGEAKKPKAHAIVNPNRLDENSPHRQLAAVGVAFLLCVSVNRKLREKGRFASAPEPDLRQWLDLVALGTVCDVVPLTGVNRAFVAQGLKVMAGRGNAGLTTVLDMCKVDEKPSVYHAGFVIGPRINAGGRVGKSDLGVRLLSTDDPAEALALAKELDGHNSERKAIESMVLDQAMEEAEKHENAAILMVAGKGWHPGVIGIVAGRIKEKFHRPTAVIAIADGIGKASARSVSGFDMGAAVIAARDAGLLLAGGGHAMAAGFTVEEAKIPALVEFLNARLPALSAATMTTRKRLFLDAEISFGGATAELAEMLERLGPFGQGNPNVRLAIHNVINMKPEPVGDSHIRTFLKDPLGKGSLSAIAFRVAGTPLGQALIASRGHPVSVAGQLRLQEWNGKQQLSLMLEDIAST